MVIAASSTATSPFTKAAPCRRLLDQIFTEHTISGVVHLAGFKYAGVSVSRPLHTYTQNVTGMVTLLESMVAHGVTNFVFSSAPRSTAHLAPIWSASRIRRIRVSYGESKLIGEWLLGDVARATASRPAPLRHTSLRYFNVVGSGYEDLRDTSPHNLFPLVFERLVAGGCRASTGMTTQPRTVPVSATTSTSPTSRSPTSPPPRLEQPAPLLPVYNLGSGSGLSVRQIMDAVARVTGIEFTRNPTAPPRRPARIVATGELAARDLDWKMRHTVDEMVATAWSARQAAELSS